MEIETVRNYVIRIYLEKLKTYNRWTDKNQLPENLARAGFELYCDGVTQCPDCQLIYRNWLEDVDPMEAHEDCSPECMYIKCFKNYSFTFDDVFNYCCSKTILQHYLDQRMCSFEHVKRGVELRLKKRFKLWDSIYEIKEYFEHCLIEKDPHPDCEVKICKICNTKQIQQVFLFCGHIYACKECGDSCIDCPICGKYINRHQPITFTHDRL